MMLMSVMVLIWTDVMTFVMFLTAMAMMPTLTAMTTDAVLYTYVTGALVRVHVRVFCVDVRRHLFCRARVCMCCLLSARACFQVFERVPMQAPSRRHLSLHVATRSPRGTSIALTEGENITTDFGLTPAGQE